VRIAHKVKKEVLAELPPEKKIEAAQYGDNDNPEARAFVSAVHHAFQLKAHYRAEPAQREAIERAYSDTVNYILRTMGKHVVRDSAFFRDVAHAIDHYHKSVDPVRAFIGVQIEAAKALGHPLPTIRKLQEALRGLGYPEDQTSDRQLRRIYAEDFNTKPPPGQVGRPCESKES
jgi:hypothetical protein